MHRASATNPEKLKHRLPIWLPLNLKLKDLFSTYLPGLLSDITLFSVSNLFYFRSGTIETSKTVEHAAFGYMVYTAVTYRFILDFGITFDDGVINDVSFCTTDLAWIDGMTAGVCGPLLCGGTAVMVRYTINHRCTQYKLTSFSTKDHSSRVLRIRA